MAAKKTRPTASPAGSSRTLPSQSSPAAQGQAAQPLLQPKRIHRPPKPLPLLRRWWLFYEGSFAGSMLETWEKILLHTVLALLLLLFYTAVSRYLPARLSLAMRRVQWYLYGGEAGRPVTVKVA